MTIALNPVQRVFAEGFVENASRLSKDLDDVVERFGVNGWNESKFMHSPFMPTRLSLGAALQGVANMSQFGADKALRPELGARLVSDAAAALDAVGTFHARMHADSGHIAAFQRFSNTASEAAAQLKLGLGT